MTNIEAIAGQFGSIRELARSIGVSHSIVSVWNARDGEIPQKHYQTVREAAAEKAKKMESPDEAKHFLTVVENCLRQDVCPTCGRAM